MLVNAWMTFGVIRSIQYPNNTITAGVSALTLTTPVVIINTIVTLLGINSTLNPDNTCGNALARCSLTSTTNVTVTGNLANGDTVYAVAIEYAPQVFTARGVQRGTISLAGVATNTATITAVGTKAQLISGGSSVINSTDARTSDIYLVLTNPTTVTANRNTARADADTVSFQVADWRL